MLECWNFLFLCIFFMANPINKSNSVQKMDFLWFFYNSDGMLILFHIYSRLYSRITVSRLYWRCVLAICGSVAIFVAFSVFVSLVFFYLNFDWHLAILVLCVSNFIVADQHNVIRLRIYPKLRVDYLHYLFTLLALMRLIHS